MTIHLCGLPGDTGPEGTGAIDPSLRLTLLRVGFTEPSRLPWMLVRSYRTVSPLPVTDFSVHRRSILCGTVLRVVPTGR